VDDVTLPPWARSPRDFLKKNRKALESDICTGMLPSWIDLIFGVKSRGEAAREASNLFHPMAYLGPKDLQKMDSDEDRFQAELQAVEFGIVPDSLFGQPHPLREDPAHPDECVLSDFGRAVLNEGEGSVGADGESRSGEQAWELLETPSSHTHEDEIMTERGRLDSSESTPSNKGEAPSIGFGSSALVNSSKAIAMAQKQARSPKAPTTPVIPESPATPGGKAKSSWSTNLSVPCIDESEQRQEEVGVSGPIDGSKPSFDEYNYLGSVQEDHRPNRKLPLSGSGDMAPHGGKRPKAGVAQAKQIDQSRSRQRAPETTPRPADEVPISKSVTNTTEWDLKMLEKKPLHSDSISGCALLVASGPQKLSFLTTVSLDGTLKVQTISIAHPQKKDRYDASRRSFTGTLSKFPYIGMTQAASTQSKLVAYRNHTSADPLACLARTSDGNGGQVVFAGGHDDVVLAYGINSACAVASVYSHRDAVTGLDIVERPVAATENLLWSENSTHIMVSGSWDATVKVWSVTVDSGETVSINREPLAELFDADSSVVCLSATTVNGGVAISAGCADGSFVVWLCHDDGSKLCNFFPHCD
jgi:WD40 repeat protein